MRNFPNRIPLGIRNERVEVGSHIAYFWQSEQEFREGVKFLEYGLRNGEACVLFGHEEANDRVLALLREAGVGVTMFEENGKLVVLGGQLSGDGMMGEIGATFQKMVEGGAPLIRLLGNIGWGREGWPHEDDILEFEAKVTGAAKAFPSVVVCMYDVASLSGRVIVDGALATHPITVCGNVLRHNPYHEDMGEFVKRLRKKTP